LTTTGQILDFNKAKRQGEPAIGAVDADDIRNRLHADPRGFINWLYSGRAFIQRNEARIGNVHGEPGASLSIQLAGPDAGLWKDHATDQGGDLIALYRAWAGYHDSSNFVLSLKEIAKEFFGDPVEVERSAWRSTPSEMIEEKKQKLGTKPRDDMLELGAPVAKYTYFDIRGNVIAAVVRYEPDGTRESKTFRPYCHRTQEGVTKWVMGAPDLRPLYRLPDIALSQTVVLCEGEGCADKLAEVGIPATSAMQGAKAPIEKTDWSPLAGKTIIIWPDNDDAGFGYAKAASERLAALGCKVLGITPPADAPAKWDAADCVSEGRDAHAIIASALPVTAAQPKPRVRLVSIGQLATMPPPTFLIDDTITVNGLSMLWGRSGSLKSFAALDQALCVATGLPWHGKAVKQGRVVYLAAEGAYGLASRAMGWMQTRGRDCSEPEFQIIPHGLALANSADLDALILALADGSPISLIVIDTLSRTFGKGNPNQPSDMNAFVESVEQLRQASGAHVMVIHHAGKDAANGEVGNEGLRNACDTVIHVKRNNTSLELINEAPRGKQKDFDEFKTVKLTPIKIAFELNGTERTTLILNTSDEAPGDDQKEAATTTIGKNEQLIIDTLRKAGQPLGFTRLSLTTNINKGSLTRALGTLVDKEIIKVDFDPSGNTKQWSL
jgi:DNA-binding HxlR family transcriptional regulator